MTEHPGALDNENFLAAILNGATDYAIFTIDRDRHITSWNVGARNLLGFSEDEILGQLSDTIFVPAEVLGGAPAAEVEVAERTGRAEDERWHLRKDGTRFWGSGVLTPLGGTSPGFVKVLRDLTREHHDREALQASETRFRTLAENIPQLVFRCLSSGERTWGSPQWENFTGLSLEDSVGHGWMDAVHPADRARTRQAWDEAVRAGEYSIEHRLRRGLDGQFRWHQTRALPLRTDAEGPLEWVGTSTDIDELRRLQERQRILLAELQHRTRNLLAVVASIAEQTRRASSSLDDFAAQFSSRLRALGRVQRLLTASSEEVQLVDVVKGELAAHAGHPNCRVSVRGDPVSLTPNAVQTLSLALHELATNALKYGALASPEGRIAVEWWVRDGGRVSFEWRETGVRMPAETPSRRGYGRQLIERALPYDLDAETDFQFGPDGVRCCIQLRAPEAQK
jgi:PAS domain S-box-containing protein